MLPSGSSLLLRDAWTSSYIRTGRRVGGTEPLVKEQLLSKIQIDKVNFLFVDMRTVTLKTQGGGGDGVLQNPRLFLLLLNAL